MRFKQFLNEEDVISKALSLKEPQIGDEISDEEKEIAIDLLNQAIEEIEKEIDKSDDDKRELLIAKLKDLEDKLEKFEKGIEEPERTVKDQPPEEPEEELPPEEEPPEE
jgi:hypothetical protein